MAYASWPCPGSGEEAALLFGDDTARHKLLIIPPLFGEANKFRHLLVETARLISDDRTCTIIPDLPGCNESPAAHEEQSLDTWRTAAAAAAAHFGATHCLAVRSAGWIMGDLPGWLYAPQRPEQALRGMIRARILATREAGDNETIDGLTAKGAERGLDLSGWKLGPALLAELGEDAPALATHQHVIDHAEIGGTAPWLRAEPDFDIAQTEALAAIVASGLAGE